MSTGIAKAIAAIGRGEVVIVTDDEDRENEGDLIMAADAVTTDALAFFLEHTSGVVCAALAGSRLDELELPLMVSDNREGQRTAFTVTVDLAHGITTGISAADRARTLRALADPHAVAGDFVRPGHILPLRSRPRRRARARRAYGGGGRSRSARRAPAGGRALGGRHALTGVRWRGAPSSRRSPSRMGCRWSASPRSGATA